MPFASYFLWRLMRENTFSMKSYRTRNHTRRVCASVNRWFIHHSYLCAFSIHTERERERVKKNWKINSAQEIIYFIFISHFQWSADLGQTEQSSLSSTMNDNSLEMPCCVCVSTMFDYGGAVLGVQQVNFFAPNGIWCRVLERGESEYQYPSVVLIAEKLSFFCCTVIGKALDLRFSLLHLVNWSKCNYDYLEFMRWLFSMETTLWCIVNVILCVRKFK